MKNCLYLGAFTVNVTPRYHMPSLGSKAFGFLANQAEMLMITPTAGYNNNVKALDDNAGDSSTSDVWLAWVNQNGWTALHLLLDASCTNDTLVTGLAAGRNRIAQASETSPVIVPSTSLGINVFPPLYAFNTLSPRVLTRNRNLGSFGQYNIAGTWQLHGAPFFAATLDGLQVLGWGTVPMADTPFFFYDSVLAPAGAQAAGMLNNTVPGVNLPDYQNGVNYFSSFDNVSGSYLTQWNIPSSNVAAIGTTFYDSYKCIGGPLNGQNLPHVQPLAYKVWMSGGASAFQSYVYSADWTAYATLNIVMTDSLTPDTNNWAIDANGILYVTRYDVDTDSTVIYTSDSAIAVPGLTFTSTVGVGLPQQAVLFGTGTQAILTLGGGTTDDGNSFNCMLVTPADDQGDSRARKQYGDMMVDYSKAGFFVG